MCLSLQHSSWLTGARCLMLRLTDGGTAAIAMTPGSSVASRSLVQPICCPKKVAGVGLSCSPWGMRSVAVFVLALTGMTAMRRAAACMVLLLLIGTRRPGPMPLGRLIPMQVSIPLMASLSVTSAPVPVHTSITRFCMMPGGSRGMLPVPLTPLLLMLLSGRCTRVIHCSGFWAVGFVMPVPG